MHHVSKMPNLHVWGPSMMFRMRHKSGKVAYVFGGTHAFDDAMPQSNARDKFIRFEDYLEALFQRNKDRTFDVVYESWPESPLLANTTFKSARTDFRIGQLLYKDVFPNVRTHWSDLRVALDVKGESAESAHELVRELGVRENVYSTPTLNQYAELAGKFTRLLALKEPWLRSLRDLEKECEWLGTSTSKTVETLLDRECVKALKILNSPTLERTGSWLKRLSVHSRVVAAIACAIDVGLQREMNRLLESTVAKHIRDSSGPMQASDSMIIVYVGTDHLTSILRDMKSSAWTLTATNLCNQSDLQAFFEDYVALDMNAILDIRVGHVDMSSSEDIDEFMKPTLRSTRVKNTAAARRRTEVSHS